MAKTRNTLKRMRAVENIRTVTNAMQTVAAVRFKVVHDHIAGFTPFGANLLETVADLLERADAQELEHPLLTPNGVHHDVLLVLTGNRGLCGSYNTGVLRLAMQRRGQLLEAGYRVELRVVGSRGVRWLEFRGVKVDKFYSGFDDLPHYPAVAALAEAMMGELLAGRIGGVEVAYTQFVSAGRQRPVVAPVLPLSELTGRRGAASERPAPRRCDFWPSQERILARLLPATVRLKLYQCFLGAGAAEQCMRRVAMQAATDNADDMIRGLRVAVNRQRQMQVTTELTEIFGGREGVGE